MIKSDINFLSPAWPEEQKNDLQWLRYCSRCSCYPAAFQWRHEWDGTDNLPDLYARRGNFRSPGKRRVAQRPPTVKQGADSADKRAAEAGCRRSKGRNTFAVVCLMQCLFYTCNFWKHLPLLFVHLWKCQVFFITFSIWSRPWVGDVCVQFRFVSRSGWVLANTNSKLNWENLCLSVKFWGQMKILSSLYILIFCLLQQIWMITILIISL